MPSRTFETVPLMQVHLDARAVDGGIPGADGRMQKIFDGPGEYEVIVSNDLADPARGHRCTIQFTG